MDYSWGNREEKQTGFGNAFLGLEYHPTGSIGALAVSAGLPLPQDEKGLANGVGAGSDINPWETFFSHWLPVLVMGKIGKWGSGSSGPFICGALGASFWLTLTGINGKMPARLTFFMVLRLVFVRILSKFRQTSVVVIGRPVERGISPKIIFIRLEFSLANGSEIPNLLLT